MGRPGWTIFDRLYVYKGIVYIVSDDASTIPDVQFIYSKGHDIKPGAAAEEKRLPTDNEIRAINTKEARRLFGTGAQLIDGVNVSAARVCLGLLSKPSQFFVNDPPQLCVSSKVIPHVLKLISG